MWTPHQRMVCLVNYQNADGVPWEFYYPLRVSWDEKGWKLLPVGIRLKLLLCNYAGTRRPVCLHCVQCKIRAAAALPQHKTKLFPLVWIVPQWVYSDFGDTPDRVRDLHQPGEVWIAVTMRFYFNAYFEPEYDKEFYVSNFKQIICLEKCNWALP